MAKKTQLANTQIVKKPKIPKEGERVRQRPKYKSFKIHKTIRHPAPALPSWWRLFKKSIALLRATYRQQFVFVVIFGLLVLVFVKGFSSVVDFDGIKEVYSEFFESDISTVAAGFTTFGLLIDAGATATDEVAQLYQTILIILSSLAIIWLYRQHQAGNQVTMKMAFYRGMYPLVPFILVMCILVLQLVPALVGNYIFSAVMQGGLAINMLEQTAWVAFLLAMFTWSLYLLSGSVIALYIVTLPEMTPLRALREAKKLVEYRRMSVMRKVIALILALIFMVIVIILPLIFWLPTVAEWLFFVMGILFVPIIHGYLFSLYRELL